mmetsp:Transcript_33691/g.82827  ORF Transcript_33691/g.82827 Transcript_33691/m.82827 type:complete len:206 (-) Transcript_33691:2064-2681(-)
MAHCSGVWFVGIACVHSLQMQALRPLKNMAPASSLAKYMARGLSSRVCSTLSSISDRVQELGDALARHPEPPPSARLLVWVVLEEQAPDPGRCGWKFLGRQSPVDFFHEAGLALLPLSHQLEVLHNHVHTLLQEAVGRMRGCSRASVQQRMDEVEGQQQAFRQLFVFLCSIILLMQLLDLVLCIKELTQQPISFVLQACLGLLGF